MGDVLAVMARSSTLWGLLALTLLMAACGAGSEPVAGMSTTTTSPPATTIGRETATVPTLDPERTAIADEARSDLAARLSVDPTTVVLVSFETVTWPDGSLGCPQPGMAYTQALVDGYQVILRVGDRLYDYHGADGKGPVLCESPEKDGGYEFVPPPGFDD